MPQRNVKDQLKPPRFVGDQPIGALARHREKLRREAKERQERYERRKLELAVPATDVKEPAEAKSSKQKAKDRRKQEQKGRSS